MAKRPTERYARAGDLAAALRDTIGAGPPTESTHVRSKSRIGLAIVGALVAVGAVLAVVALTRDGEKSASPPASPSAAADVLPRSSLARIDPETGQASLVIRDVPGLEPGNPVDPYIAVGEGGVWLYSFSHTQTTTGAFMLQLDEETGATVREQIPVSFVAGVPAALAVGSRTVWFIGADEATRVSRLNPSTHERLEPVSIRAGAATDIVLGGGALWVGSTDGTLTEFDPLTGRRLDEIPIDGTPDALAFGAGSIWALDSLGNQIIRIDPSSKRVVDRIDLNGNLDDIAAGTGGVWVLDNIAGIVTRIDPDTNAALAPIPVGPDPFAIAVGFGSAWVTDAEDGNLYRVDPDLGRASAIELGAPLAALAVDEVGRSLWVGVFAEE